MRFSFLLACLLFLPRAAGAQWSSNGNPIVVSPGDQSSPATATDGAAGAFVVWIDSRSGTGSDLYLQRITSAGAIAAGWTSNGNALCLAANDQLWPVIVDDGSGGAFVAWEDDRAGLGDANVYLQRITASGAVAAGWPAGGLAVCSASGDQTRPALALESGMAVVAWEDARGASTDIYAQKVSGTGVPQWTPDGVAACSAVGAQTAPSIVGDQAGGAIVAWQDTRAGMTADIYAQRLNVAGAAQWGAGGIALCAAVNDQLGPRAVTDAAGGAIVVWDDYRANNGDVYAQRVNAAGAAQWTAGGVALCSDLGEQYSGAPVSDGAGGAIVPWDDYRGGPGALYAQKISAGGAIAWPLNGLGVCTMGDISDPVAAPDGAGGAFFAWDDARAGGNGVDLYALRVTSAGALGAGWATGGSLICNAANNQLVPVMATDLTGSAVVSWLDGRVTVMGNDIYAQRLLPGGALDVPPSGSSGLALHAAPNPMVSGAVLRFSLSSPQRVRLEVLDLTGRVVRELLPQEEMAAGERAVSWDGRDGSGASVPAGLYWVRLATPTGAEVRPLVRLR